MMGRLWAVVIAWQCECSWLCECCGHHNPPQHDVCRRCRAQP